MQRPTRPSCLVLSPLLGYKLLPALAPAQLALLCFAASSVDLLPIDPMAPICM